MDVSYKLRTLNFIDIQLSAKENIKDEDELLPVLLMSSVLIYSNEFWTYPERTGYGWFGIALSDVINGGKGALWSSIAAGPLDAVVIGVNGAIIGSATANIIGQI